MGGRVTGSRARHAVVPPPVPGMTDRQRSAGALLLLALGCLLMWGVIVYGHTPVIPGTPTPADLSHETSATIPRK